MSAIDHIRTRLEETLHPLQLEITDQSHKHVGHAGAKNGGHFRVFIVAEAFVNRPLIARHRMVYQALADNLRREIHALSIVARAPGELGRKRPSEDDADDDNDDD